VTFGLDLKGLSYSAWKLLHVHGMESWPGGLEVGSGAPA
jgi:hypothetical protein